MSHRFFSKHKKILPDEKLMAEKCRGCKTGVLLLKNYKDYHYEKCITKKQFMEIARDNSGRCFSCQYNLIHGAKKMIAKTAQKLPNSSVANFQELDMYEETDMKRCSTCRWNEACEAQFETEGIIGCQEWEQKVI